MNCFTTARFTSLVRLYLCCSFSWRRAALVALVVKPKLLFFIDQCATVSGCSLFLYFLVSSIPAGILKQIFGKGKSTWEEHVQKFPRILSSGKICIFFFHEGSSRHLDERVEVRSVSDVNFVACGVKPLGCTVLNPKLSSVWMPQTVWACFIEYNLICV